MEEGYYSKRLDELEKRKIELLAQRKINKMSLDGVNREIEACKEAMNNQTKVVNTHTTSKDTYILKLENQLDEANDVINLLKRDKTQLKHDLSIAKDRINELEQQLELEKINNENLNENIQWYKNNIPKKENIFEEMLNEKRSND